MREQILTRPAYVAQMTGIEQIGYLADLEQPGKSVKLASLIDVYAAKPGLSSEEATRCKRIWEEFRRVVGVATLRELAHEHVERYEKFIAKSGLGPKSIKHRYSRVKTVVSYAMKRGQNAKDCRQALDRLAMLEAETSFALDPDPIKPVQFWKIHAQSVKAGDDMFAAMMLFSLNCALYPSEAGAVRWADIDLDRGEFVTRRNKTKVPRVAVLWPETITALKALPYDRPTVFNTAQSAYQRYSVHRVRKVYRAAASLSQATFAQI